MKDVDGEPGRERQPPAEDLISGDSEGRPAQPGEVTRLLQAMRNGEPDVAARLIPRVYDELRRLAASYLRRERRDHTLQATALVHEAYLRLVEQHTPWQSRAHFFGVAAQLMRRILVDYARARQANKRGGENVRVPLDEALLLSHADSQNLLDLDLALSRLSDVDVRLENVFTLRFFGGLSVNETAEVLKVGARTINRDWRMAQAWLRRELGT